MIGAYVHPRTGWTDTEVRNALLAHESMIGRKLDIVHEFNPWSSSWNLDRLKWYAQGGRIPMVSWDGYYYSSIANGSQDSVIRDRARTAKAVGSPIILRFFWEPNASKGVTWGYRTDPARFVEVWKRVRSIFRSEGATNVVWLWSPTAWGFKDGTSQLYYPGDSQVDWVGGSGYLWMPCRPKEVYNTFEYVFSGVMTFAASHKKPAVASEWGAGEAGGGSTGPKPSFINSAADAMKAHPEMVAAVYFDTVGSQGCDWRVDSSTAAKTAYQTYARKSYFKVDHSLLQGLTG